MVFRKVVLFLTALLAVLYILAFLNNSSALLPLAEYWMPRRSQLPGFVTRDSLQDLTLDAEALQHLAQVDALAETLDEEVAPDREVSPSLSPTAEVGS